MEGHIIPSLIWLCYAGQRAMRGVALWEGILFLNAHPEFSRARPLQVVMVVLEIHGAWRCFKHLPSLGDVSGGDGGSGKSGSRKKKVAAAVAPVVSALGVEDSSSSSSPGGVSPRSSKA
jgi:hypothetical protein